MEYTSKYKAEEIEAILDAKNNTGEGVDGMLDGLFVDALQTKDVEASESMEITPDEGYLGLKKVNVSVKGGGGGSASVVYIANPSVPLLPYAFLVKADVTLNGSTSKGIVPFGVSYIGAKISNIIAGAYYLDARIIINGQDTTIAQALQMAGSYTEITEEEFYNLNL